MSLERVLGGAGEGRPIRTMGSWRRSSSAGSRRTSRRRTGSARSVGGSSEEDWDALSSASFDWSASSASFRSSGASLPVTLRDAMLPSVPDCFRCAISGHVMSEPVVLPDSSVCERSIAEAAHPGTDLQNYPALAAAIKGYIELRQETERQRREWLVRSACQGQQLRKRLSKSQHRIRALHAELEGNLARIEALEHQEPVAPQEEVATECPEKADETLQPDAFGPPCYRPRFSGGPAPRSEAMAEATAKHLSGPRQRRSAWAALRGGGA
mmetsp:Transcript_60225/g.173777  ORF Transcript_60225/g.173777 Transcript_60225/m.173777 type:complete len:269 (+) Transcript_60225:50-856(+)